LIIVWGAADLIRGTPFNRPIVALVPLAILAGLCVASSHQVGYWRNSSELWTHTLEITKNNVVAYDNLGGMLLAKGNTDGLAYFQSAARIAAWDPESHAAIAATLHERGQLQEAIDEYGIALRANPDAKLKARIYAYLGVIYRELGEYPKARESSRLAVVSDSGEVETIIRQIAVTLEKLPAPSGYWLLGSLLEGTNKVAEARAAYARALMLNPQFAPAIRSLGALHLNSETSTDLIKP